MRGVKGFTLMEAVLTITLVGIAAVAGTPFFTDVGATTADSAAKKLLADLNYVRRLAQSRSGVYGISFNASQESYTAYQYDPVAGTSTTITNPHTQEAMVVDFDTLPGLAGANLQNPSFGGTVEIRFTAQGFPQNASNVNLAATGSVQVTSYGTTKTLQVQPNTGEVTIQ